MFKVLLNEWVAKDVTFDPHDFRGQSACSPSASTYVRGRCRCPARLPTKKKQITMWVGEKWLVERQLNIGGRAYATDLSPQPQRTIGPNNKNPLKFRLPKFVKLTISYLFLQLFDKFLT